MSTKVILGGGIAGLIWAFYNDGTVISPEFGGQMNNHFSLGPRYLHDNEWARRFLTDIGLPIKKLPVTIGYWYEGSVHPEPKDKHYISAYHAKSRGFPVPANGDSTTMTGSMNEFVALEVDFPQDHGGRVLAHLSGHAGGAQDVGCGERGLRH